jgi:hypothetical protein
MIRKAGHISLIVLLLLTTMGVTLTKHYCGSLLIEHTINVIPDNCCNGYCNDCHNESKLIKVTDNFESSDAKFNFKNSILRIFVNTNFATVLLICKIEDSFTTNLFSKVKICSNYLIPIEHTTSNLQVFRL